MRKIEIAGRIVGEGEPCFIIAEAGINHNGDVDLAKRLVDVAKEAGADAVKFQTFRAEELLSKDALRAKHLEAESSLFEMVRALEFRRDEVEQIAEHATSRSVMFMSTPLGEESADLLYDMGVPVYKVASGDVTNLPLLRHIGHKGLPIILSTGMASLAETEEAVETLYSTGNEDVALLHCVASYPAPLAELNLRVMETLSQAFQLPTGFSDHTVSTAVPVIAAALGARIIEKHFTLDKNLPGPDHKASASPDELRQIVAGIREVQVVSGSRRKMATDSEEQTRAAFRRSIVAERDIPRGERITGEMLAIKRPGTGIPPRFLDIVVSREAKRDIKADEVIGWEDI